MKTLYIYFDIFKNTLKNKNKNRYFLKKNE